MIPNPQWSIEDAQPGSLYVDSPEQAAQQQVGCIRCDQDDPAPQRIYLMNGMSMCYTHAYAQDFTNSHGEAEHTA